MIGEPRPEGVPALDELLDAQFQRLLADLHLLVPCDAAAAWFSQNDRPVLRALQPRDAHLSSDDISRQAIFGATAEAARIGDLAVMGDAGGKWRSWLGVPLMIDGQRRGWIEAFSLHPYRFSQDDLLRAEVLVRHAAEALTWLVRSQEARREQALQHALLGAVADALLSADARRALPLLVERLAALETAIEAGALLLPAERAYALGLTAAAEEPTAVGGSLVVVVARWESARTKADDTPMITVLLPLRHDTRLLGWLSLRTSMELSPHRWQRCRQIGAVLSAFLVWLEAEALRVAHAQRAARVLLQQTHQLRLLGVMDLARLLRPLIDASLLAVTDGAAGAQSGTEAVRLLARARSLLAALDDPDARVFARVRLADIVEDAVAAIRATAEASGVVVQLRMSDPSPIVLGRRAHLWLVCLELLQNALDAVVDVATPTIVVEVAVVERTAVVRVRDNGCGIPPAGCERIFAPGYTTKLSETAGPRLGLGLALAREIAHAHQGRLTVESDVWQGSTFCLLLPLV